VDDARRTTLILPLVERSTALRVILDLDVLLGPREDVPHLDDFILHQVLIERIGDLQPTNERHDSNIVVAVIH